MRPYSPTDLSSPLIGSLGHPFVYPSEDGEEVATLVDVCEDGTVTLGLDGFVVAVLPASEIRPLYTGGYR